MTEKDNEKLSMEEMEETAGGVIGSKLDILKKMFPQQETTYIDAKCYFCGTVNKIPTGPGISSARMTHCTNCGNVFSY